MEEICPKCIGAEEIMVPKNTKGFEYIICDVCGGSGMVPPDIAEDYVNSAKPFDIDES